MTPAADREPVPAAGDSFDSVLHLMEVRGGSFVRALAACYYAADPSNRMRLRAAFSDYFQNYEAQFLENRRAFVKARTA
jgi:hypothetical protein